MAFMTFSATKADDAFTTALPLARGAAEKYSKNQAAKIEKKVEPLSKALSKGESLASAGKTAEAQQVVSDALNAGVAAGLATEGAINNLGYDYLDRGKTEMALAVFGFNVNQFPQSSNVYDSMGEALMKAGRIDESIRNYKKAVELDPGNENAKALIEKMEKENGKQ
ncbi:MAG TPA: hypothetical protein DEP53_13305 [Bacteroidetes bacterium]|nr:MAG: hypothetical protein A2X66_00110 [Ignavibacteria bacterium GWA2_54_16]HCA80699.1 hypothetical protein [Bacteroidota bacterium]